MKALVTGANGFVGRVLCQHLKDAGWFVRAAVRRQTSLPDGNECVVVGEIDGTTEWGAAVEGIDVVFHLAGRVHMTGRRRSGALADYRRTNVDGTSHLMRSAVESGVGHVVFVSSIKVNGEATHGEPFREGDEPRPEDDYARSKFEAESALLAWSVRSSTRVTIVRPPLVYGPGVGANFRALLDAVYYRVPLPLASVENRRSLVSVENLADALIFLAHADGGGQSLFLISDGAPISTPQLIRGVAGALNRTPVLFPFPPRLLGLAGRFMGFSGMVERLTTSLEVDSSRLLERGWRPRWSFEVAMARTAAWYLSRSDQP